MIIDCHTHRSHPAPNAIISTSPIGFAPHEEQQWSVGFHPWHLDLYCDNSMRIKDKIWTEMVAAAAKPEVVAIGECGIDLSKNILLATQLTAFRRQALLAERLHKPLVIHAVRAYDIIIGLKKDINPMQKWVIHGFRNKPSIAAMYLEAGCYLSFGEKFNPNSLAITPDDKILAETDESAMPVDSIIARLEESSERNLKEFIIQNGKIFEPI